MYVCLSVYGVTVQELISILWDKFDGIIWSGNVVILTK